MTVRVSNMKAMVSVICCGFEVSMPLAFSNVNVVTEIAFSLIK